MTHPLVVVANRLPVDQTTGPDGSVTWQRSPGGLVTAMEPVMREADGAWVGWSGSPGDAPEPFDADGMRLVPVPLSPEDVADFYEGFANDTLWPLSHDVINPPVYHRHWWDAYRRVNRRYAQAAAAEADPGGTVWVHDYQLQLVPAMLRELRDDVRIGYFHHIPFPPLELFAQLPWRRQVVEGLLGADLVGFQRSGDAANFLRVVRRWTDLPVRAGTVTVTDHGAGAQGPGGLVPHLDRLAPVRRAGPVAVGPGQGGGDPGRPRFDPRCCCSASTGWTTPRASCTASRPSGSSSPSTGSRCRAPPSSRWPARAGRTSRPTSSSARTSSCRSAGSTASTAGSAPSPSTTCTTPTRRRRWPPCTGPPTSCSSPRCATG